MVQQSNGQEMYNLAKKIFPYCRSITGQGVRDTLRDLKEYIEQDGNNQMEIYEILSGTSVFDWTVPKEWVIREAYIEDESGNHIIDMKEHNLHVVGYSTPVDEWVDLCELKKHIFTQPDQPDVIPYITSYYKERYGFCMSENQLSRLIEGRYHMYIDSELIDGVLNYAEVVIPGETEQEIFFSTYICHPSMANNECSGPAVEAELIRYVRNMEHRKYTYRFLFIPETIGSIAYMSTKNHLAHMKEHMLAGFILTCVGDDQNYSIVHSRYGDNLADRVLQEILNAYTSGNFSEYDFLKRGSDERQYCAPGVDLPMVTFSRTKFHEYPEYHTSADDLNYISPQGLFGAYEVMTKTIQALEYNAFYHVKVLCEPQLGKRGLYPTISQKGSYNEVQAMTNFIAYADGENDLIAISKRIREPLWLLIPIVQKLLENDLIYIKDH